MKSFELTKDELKSFSRLSTPQKIQDFLDTLPINEELHGETCYSPRTVLQKKTAHCLEGALFAGLALSLSGERPLIMNLKTRRGDDDHAVALFQRNGYWGAISKTNHAVLRWRDPIFKTLRELALSYFHEYFLYNNGAKTLRGFSHPLNLNTFNKEWATREDSLWDIADTLASSKHTLLIPKGNERHLRNATVFERETLEQKEWN